MSSTWLRLLNVPGSSINLTRAVALLLRMTRLIQQTDRPQVDQLQFPPFQEVHAALIRLVAALAQADSRSWHVADDALRVVKAQLRSESDLPGIEIALAQLSPPVDVFSGDLHTAGGNSQSVAFGSTIWDPQMAFDASNDDLAALFSLGLQGEWINPGQADMFSAM